MFISSLKTLAHIGQKSREFMQVPQNLLHWNDPTPASSSHPWWIHPTSARQQTYQYQANEPNIFSDRSIVGTQKSDTAKVLWSPGIRTDGSSGSLQGCPASGPSGRRWVHGGHVPSAAPGAYPEVPASHYCGSGATQTIRYNFFKSKKISVYVHQYFTALLDIPARPLFCCGIHCPLAVWWGSSGYNTSSAPSWCWGNQTCFLSCLCWVPCSFLSRSTCEKLNEFHYSQPPTNSWWSCAMVLEKTQHFPKQYEMLVMFNLFI